MIPRLLQIIGTFEQRRHLEISGKSKEKNVRVWHSVFMYMIYMVSGPATSILSGNPSTTRKIKSFSKENL